MITQHTLFAIFAVNPTFIPCFSANAAEFTGPAVGEVIRVIDGDTVKMRIPIWIDQEVVVSVRIAGIDAPEIFRPKCAAEKELGMEAKAFVAHFLDGGEAILRDIEHDKYAGRAVAHVEAGNGDLADALVAAGLAVSEPRRRWCD